MKTTRILTICLLLSFLLSACGTGKKDPVDPTPSTPDEPPYVSQVLLDKPINVENGGNLLEAVAQAIIVMDDKDGQITITQNMLTPQVDTTKAGTYNVTLTVTDTGNNTSTFNLSVIIAQPVVETLAKEDFLKLIDETGWLDLDHAAEHGYGLTFYTDEGGFRFTYGSLDSDMAVTGYLENYYPLSETVATFTGTYTLATDDVNSVQNQGEYTITIDLTKQKTGKTIVFNYDFGLGSTTEYVYDETDVTYTYVGEADMLAISAYWHESQQDQ